MHRGLFSIHDLMPHTLEGVGHLLEAMHGFPPETIALLVVPGHDWNLEELRQLQRWKSQGHQIVGHGWFHRCGRIKTLQHRLHSWLISRDVAEHLSKSEEEVAGLITACHSWLVEHELGPVDCYVPPAWAMGNISRARLTALPFRFYEFQGGMFDARENRFHRLPLMGFEADTLFRAMFLRIFNRANQVLAGKRAIRVSLHPFDLDYRLGPGLRELLTQAGDRMGIQPCKPVDLFAVSTM